jgi:hypothetical protein
MGREFVAPTESNPLGFYEESAVLRINDRFFIECGVNRWGTWPSRREVLACAEKHATAMGRAAADLLDGWKDPRFCLTLEAWLPYLPRKPKLIVCLRSPGAHIESALISYGAQSMPGARRSVEERWRCYNERLLEFIDDFALEATCVEYDELLAQPGQVVARLSAFVGRPLDAGYVTPSLRHHVAPVSDSFAMLYQRVGSLGEGRAVTS